MSWVPLAFGVLLTAAALLAEPVRRRWHRSRFARRWSPGIARAMNGGSGR